MASHDGPAQAYSLNNKSVNNAKIPVELLSQIFLHLVDLHTHVTEHRYSTNLEQYYEAHYAPDFYHVFDDDLDFDDQFHHRFTHVPSSTFALERKTRYTYEWLVVLQVCRFWHAAALACPWLWRYVENDSLERLRHLRALTQGVPLVLCTYENERDGFRRVISDLQRPGDEDEDSEDAGDCISGESGSERYCAVDIRWCWW